MSDSKFIVGSRVVRTEGAHKGCKGTIIRIEDNCHLIKWDDGDESYSHENNMLLLEESDASSNQVGGNHYSKLAIQPMEYALKNDLNYAQANAIKYITRYKDKNGVEDLRKAIHCIELLIEHESTEENYE